MTKSGSDPDALICSAKGCQQNATQHVVWNNPKIHTPDREKIWLSCDEHDGYLRDFLARRGFYRRTARITDSV